MRKRLFWQVFWAQLATTVVLIVGLGIYASLAIHDYYREQKDVELEAAARACELNWGDSAGASAPPGLQAVCASLSKAMGVRLTVVLASGKVAAESAEDPRGMESHLDRPEIQTALGGSVGRATRFSATLRETERYLAVPVLRQGRVVAAIRTSFPIWSFAQTLNAVYSRIAVVGLVGAMLVAVASLALARRIARPLEVLRSGVERLARNGLKHRLPISGAEEVRMLAESMNRMAEQLDQRIETIVSQERERQAVLSSMEEGVLAVDERARILNLNDTGATLLSVDPATVRGRLVHEVIRKSALLGFIERTLASPEPVEEDFEVRGPEPRWLHAHGTSLHDAQNRKMGALVVLHDVTRLRHLENVRRDFVANVSHELRTPITSIKGFVETLLDEDLADKETSLRFLRIVLKQVNRLDEIIKDLLTLSRVERGTEEQTIQLELVPLAGVLHSAAEMCEKKASDKQICVTVDCAEDLAAHINAPLLEQAVVNLVDNAIKYSDAGGAVRVFGCVGEGTIVIRVHDEGCGIEAKHLPRLFERFYRVDRARSRELGGTGLGLAIVKHIVASHKGLVRVESIVGQGSNFTIELPMPALIPSG